MKRGMRIWLMVSLTPLSVLATILLAVWTWPTLLLNPSSLKYFQSFLVKKGYTLSWENLALSVRSEGFLTKNLAISTNNFCFANPDNSLSVCVRSATLNARLGFSSWPLKIDIAEAQLYKPEIVSAQGPHQTKSSEEAQNQESNLKSWLKATRFEHVRVESAKFVRKAATGKFTVLADTHANRENEGSLIHVRMRIEDQTSEKTVTASLDGHLKSLKSLWFGPYALKADTKVSLPDDQYAEAKIVAAPKANEGNEFEIRMNYRGKGLRKAKAHLKGDWRPEGPLATVLQADMRELGLPRLTAKGCKINLSLGARPINIKADCPLSAEGYFDTGKPSLYQKLVPTADAVLTVQLRLEDTPKTRRWVAGEVALVMDPLLQRAKHGRAGIQAQIQGRLADFPKGWDLKTSGNIEIDEFRRIARLLHDTPWAIPEPFNGLDGKISLAVNGQGKIGELTQTSFPIEISSRLNSQSQRMNIDSSGEWRLQSSPQGLKQHLNFKVTLSDVHLWLPTLEPRSLPRLYPDKRIVWVEDKKETKRAEKNSSFTYEIEILTPEGKFLELSSNLARDKIPVALLLRKTDSEALSGTIRVASFPLELLRRKGRVDHFDIKMKKGVGVTEIDGEIRVFYTDYTIRVLTLGVASNPRIKVLSHPPLPESEAIAVLLYGRRSSELSPEEAASAANTKVALTDRAIGLASMYLLASTPIESVNYDPGSETFSAHVRLADGTTMTVGTNLKELERIGIRRRLGRDWSITTRLEEPLNPVERRISALLEWSRAY